MGVKLPPPRRPQRSPPTARTLRRRSPEIKPGPPPVLTKRGADILVRVEKLLDDAAKTADKTVGGEPPKPAQAGAVAARSPSRTALRRPRPATRPAAAQELTTVRLLFVSTCWHWSLRRRRRPRHDLDDADARHRIRRAHHRRLDRVAETGTADIDPYARATIARNGELPIGSGDGVAFFARADDNEAAARRPLRRRRQRHRRRRRGSGR